MVVAVLTVDVVDVDDDVLDVVLVVLDVVVLVVRQFSRDTLLERYSTHPAFLGTFIVSTAPPEYSTQALYVGRKSCSVLKANPTQPSVSMHARAHSFGVRACFICLLPRMKLILGPARPRLFFSGGAKL